MIIYKYRCSYARDRSIDSEKLSTTKFGSYWKGGKVVMEFSTLSTLEFFDIQGVWSIF